MKRKAGNLRLTKSCLTPAMVSERTNLLRLSIETSGEVSMCKVESTDLGSPELVAMIVERIRRFNFGPKEGVPKMTILYPIDFLPAG